MTLLIAALISFVIKEHLCRSVEAVEGAGMVEEGEGLQGGVAWVVFCIQDASPVADVLHGGVSVSSEADGGSTDE